MEKFVTQIKRKKSDESRKDDSSKLQKKEDDDNSVSGESETSATDKSTISFRKIRCENLNCDYTVLFSKKEADELLKECEESLTYNSGELSQVFVFGKWHDIPRKQVAHGESGLSYTFSGKTLPAKRWTPLLLRIRERITQVTGHAFNFVLINRYKDGSDHMGEHRDDEKELVKGSPIASLSLGQPRDFVFKHADSRGKKATRVISPVKLLLEHGSLLMMKHPTNEYWYHSLPCRKKLSNVRINMTFRQMVNL